MMNIGSNKIEKCLNKDPLLIQLKPKLEAVMPKTPYHSNRNKKDAFIAEKYPFLVQNSLTYFFLPRYLNPNMNLVDWQIKNLKMKNISSSTKSLISSSLDKKKFLNEQVTYRTVNLAEKRSIDIKKAINGVLNTITIEPLQKRTKNSTKLNRLNSNKITVFSKMSNKIY